MKFDVQAIENIREALLGHEGDDLIRFMHDLALGKASEDHGAESRAKARELEWVGSDGHRTELGICAEDSCREYQFWTERQRALPFEGVAPQLAIERFRGRRVLEIGSGMGTNLMSFALQGAKVMGVEPIEAYVQMGAIFCEREGMDPPEVQQGSAEALPFDDGEFDLVLCVSAHQYFDLAPAFAEINRVLASSGEAIIIGGTLWSYFFGTVAELPSNPRKLKGLTITTLNTLSYSWLGQRVVPARNRFSTSRPIYPGRSAMTRMLRRAGLKNASPPTQVETETCFHVKSE
ncbi:class I SAM-dependent methyltransferase (plasmid) [Ruegeria sp. SCSIO 43209]|uniref:class I SAM-dependent methyltransferase n=1 Tax=Ruegeria sp. SCSIO 43209 TaxID=2793010 RepID=UPI00147F139F|nr:class I SAM-dependent methyltransferase [Ruegeria sp. SCSIO 43209]UAB91724.1 class I SAM-dependent methyltransferase [Ruegeria sp. SCSIO 43209]